MSIIAYTYKADIYHPSCISLVLDTGEGGDFDGWALTIGEETIDPEANLNEIAAAYHIDREDESTFDHSYFPKMVFSGQAAGYAICGYCSDPINDNDDESE